jgi:signal transduction histidine kinase
MFQIDGSGQIISGQIGMNGEPQEWEEILDSQFIMDLATGSIIKEDGMIFYKRSHPEDPRISQLFIQKSWYPIEDLIRDILRFLVMDLLILAPFWFLGRYFVRQILKPVEENMEVMGHFVHDAGHELKTPLAIVSGNLQILRDMKGKDEELIDASISTISSLAGSLDGLVELSNLKIPAKIENMNLSSHVEEILTIYSQEIERKNITVTTTIPKNVYLKIDAKHFSILFWNLLKNAIHYNKKWGSIRLDYTGKILSITDTGIGMNESDTKKIFERFYRVDRSGKIPGSGIGLALVDRILKLYDWSISVESKLDQGTIFSIKTK